MSTIRRLSRKRLATPESLADWPDSVSLRVELEAAQ